MPAAWGGIRLSESWGGRPRQRVQTETAAGVRVIVVGVGVVRFVLQRAADVEELGQVALAEGRSNGVREGMEDVIDVDGGRRLTRAGDDRVAPGATDGSGSPVISADGTDRSSRQGLLRADWTRKHRERRPAVALAFLPHEEVEGDPNAWVTLTRRIDALRDAAASAGSRLALVVVGDDAPERLPEDRVAALTRQAGIARNHLVSMPQPPTPDAMRAVDTRNKPWVAVETDEQVEFTKVSVLSPQFLSLIHI